ncbi:MAG: hypothetical protein QM712_19500 [Bradyrhizobium sp.]
MLPGLRFVLAAILLSTSILVFGLGAAALLRATHEQYVNNPSWRTGPQERVFAQASEPAQPVLAALQVEPAVTAPEPSLRDQVPTVGLPVNEPEQSAAPAAEADVQPEPKVADAASTTETPAAEPARMESAQPTPTDTLTPADTTAAIPADKPTATASEPAPAGTTAVAAQPAAETTGTKTAALNDPATTGSKDQPAKTKADSSASDGKAAKQRAQRAKKRHRVVRHAPPPQMQQSYNYNPFLQPQPSAATTARR